MTATNPYLDLIRTDQTQALRQSLLTAVDKNPDTEAGLQRLARQYGLPVDAVREDAESVRRRAKLDAVDYSGLLRFTPVTANLLADPQLAAIAHDDIDNLSTLESLLNAFKLGIPAMQSLPVVLQVLNQAAGLDQLDPVDKAAAKGERLSTGELGVLAESYAAKHAAVVGGSDALAEAFAGLFAAPGEVLSASAKRLGEQRQHARQAKQQAALLAQIDSVAAQSRVLKRDPQTMRNFVAAALADSERGELRIDAKELLDSGAAEALAVLLPDVAKHLPAAVALGREVSVPVGAYVSRLAATDLAPALAGLWRVGATPFSRDQALLYQQQRDAAEQAEIERLAGDSAEPFATAPELAKVKAAVLEQLQQAAPFSAADNAMYAELHAHFYAAQAQRFGVTPEELLTFMGANVASAELDDQHSVSMEQDFRPGADVRGAFNPHTRTITLFPQADLSTFLHESGHLFLEIQFDLTSRLLRFAGRRALSPAQQALIADSNTLLAWFGLRSLEDWRQLDFAQMRVYHEQFATGFEKYLYQGVAPSLGLARIFATFRQWLMAVYAHFKSHWPGLALPDDVRGVFDRMLASDAALRQGWKERKTLSNSVELTVQQKPFSARFRV